MQRRPKPGNPFAAMTAAAYVLLSCIYLAYWRYTQYFVDDWFLLKQFRVAGGRGIAHFIVAAAQNNLYQKFRMHWLGIVYGFLIASLGGHSARVYFTVLLLVHAACAWLLCQGLARLGLAYTLSFLAGTFYLLAPTVHFALFTNLTNPFFVLGTFWVLMLFWWSAGRFASDRIGPGGVAVACLFAVAALFSGEQAFLLVWAIVPLAAWCFLPRPVLRQALRLTASLWIALGASAAVYLLQINRAPVGQTGLRWRYEWTWRQLINNLATLGAELRRMAGLSSDAPFHVSLRGRDLLLAGAAGLLVSALAWIWHASPHEKARLPRIGLFAIAGVLLAYGPVLLIGGGYSRYRYHYTPSPYLGLGAAAACWMLARPRPRLMLSLAGGLVTAYFALNAMAEIRQCWIPQSQQQSSLETAIRTMKNVAPGDILIVSGTPFEIGTAQHFTMHSSVSANPFAEWATGAAPLEVGLDLLDIHGRLTLYETDYQRPLSAAEIARTHILVSGPGGRFSYPEWVAQQIHPGRFRLWALKNSSISPGTAAFSGDQLALAAGRIYFSKPVHPQ
jgi:hypothetical protein